MYYRHLVVTQSELLELRMHPTEDFLAAVAGSHSLRDVTKITFKKTNPNLLTFEFAGHGREQYLVEEPIDCIKSIREAIASYLQRADK